MAKKYSPTEKAYAKELRRIKQFINRAEKRGYIIPDTVIPKRPTRVTKASVNKLSKITPESIYKKSKFVDVETGEIIKAQTARKAARSDSAKRAAKTRKIRAQAEKDFWTLGTFDNPIYPLTEMEMDYLRGMNIIDEIMSRLNVNVSDVYENSLGSTRRRMAGVVEAINSGKQRLIGVLNARINEIGEEELGKVLNAKAEEINSILDQLSFASKSNQAYNAVALLTQIINGGSLDLSSMRAADDLEEFEGDWNDL